MVHPRIHRSVSAALGVAVVVTFGGCTSATATRHATGHLSPVSTYNASRTEFSPAANSRARQVVDRIVRSGIPCTNPRTSAFGALRVTYVRQRVPLPLGSAECDGGSAKENVVVEVFGSKAPDAATFMARKAALICRRGLVLGRRPDGTNGFPGLPYVMSADKTWLVEPDTQAFNGELARALGRPALDACSP